MKKQIFFTLLLFGVSQIAHATYCHAPSRVDDALRGAIDRELAIKIAQQAVEDPKDIKYAFFPIISYGSPLKLDDDMKNGCKYYNDKGNIIYIGTF